MIFCVVLNLGKTLGKIGRRDRKYQFGNLFGFGKTLHWCPPNEGLCIELTLRDQLVQEICSNIAGRHSIDANTLIGPFDRKDLGEHVHCAAQ
jgi:hypothetical protein